MIKFVKINIIIDKNKQERRILLKIMKKAVIYVVVILILLITIGIFGVIFFYNSNLSAINSADSNEIEVEIKNGSTATDIAKVLEENKLIKNAFVFKMYTKINKVTGMQAGTYKLNQNMDVEQIVKKLQNGTDYFPDEIDITFLEGKNMRWIAKTISEKTNNTEDDVFKKLEDKEYINSLIESNKYPSNLYD